MLSGIVLSSRFRTTTPQYLQPNKSARRKPSVQLVVAILSKFLAANFYEFSKEPITSLHTVLKR